MNEIDTQLKKLFTSARMVSMPEERKRSLKNELVSRVYGQTVQSPYVFQFFHQMAHSRMAGSFIALIFIVSGSVSYASAHSLPGEVLYPVKTQVNEKVEGFLVLGEKSKASFEVTLASRRLTEVTLLAKTGKLDPVVQAEVVASIQEHVQKASDHVSALTKDNQLSDAKEVSQSLEQTLTENVSSLTKIVASENDTQSQNTAPLLALVQEQTQVAQETNARVDVEIASTVTVTDEVQPEDFEDTESLDDLPDDYFDGDSTYKDELAITDGEEVPDTIDAPLDELPVATVTKDESRPIVTDVPSSEGTLLPIPSVKELQDLPRMY